MREGEQGILRHGLRRRRHEGKVSANTALHFHAAVVSHSPRMPGAQASSVSIQPNGAAAMFPQGLFRAIEAEECSPQGVKQLLTRAIAGGPQS